MKIYQYTLVNAESMASSITSSAQSIPFTVGFSVQAVYTGSPVGTLKLQASIDGTNWADITDSSYSVSGAGNYIWNFNGSFFDTVRVVYTRSSGTGSLTVYLNSKGF